MASFTYMGDHAETVCFGIRFRANVPAEVNDDFAARKLRGNREFVEAFDGVEVLPAEPKRRGRPPKER
jgi:hypothetical protein